MNYRKKTPEEMESLFKKWFLDNISIRELSEREGISPHTIVNWRRKLGHHLNAPVLNRCYRHGTPFYLIHGFKSEQDLKDKLAELYYKENKSQQQIAKIFDTVVGQISRLFKKYRIKTRSFSDGNILRLRENVTITKPQQEMIDGMMLGDGHIDQRKHTSSIKYTCKHHSVLIDLANKLPFVSRITKRVKDNSINYNLSTLCYKQLVEQRRRWYPNGKKIVPNLQLTPTTCYWWYLGDGSSGNNELRLCTNSFSTDEVKILIDQLMNITNPVKLRMVKNSNTKKIEPIISILTAGIIPFLEYIGPCQHIDYKYKWYIRKGRSIRSKRYLEITDYSTLKPHLVRIQPRRSDGRTEV